MWSLGCIVVELFLGLPLFPGSSEYNQVSRINEMLGLPPTWMLESGKQSGEFFEKTHDEFGRRTYRLKPMDQYSREHGSKEQPSKKYFSATTLPEIIRNYPMPRKGMKQAEIDRGKLRWQLMQLCSADCRRNGKQGGLYRLCARPPQYQSFRALDSSASSYASLHHAAKVHRALSASDAPQTNIVALTSTWCTATATSRGALQTARTGCTATTGTTDAICSRRECCLCRRAYAEPRLSNFVSCCTVTTSHLWEHV